MNTLPIKHFAEHFHLARNVGEVDIFFRLAIGYVLCFAAAFGHIGAWGWLGLIPIASGFLGFCPFYAMTGSCTKATFSELFSKP